MDTGGRGTWRLRNNSPETPTVNNRDFCNVWEIHENLWKLIACLGSWHLMNNYWMVSDAPGMPAHFFWASKQAEKVWNQADGSSCVKTKGINFLQGHGWIKSSSLTTPGYQVDSRHELSPLPFKRDSVLIRSSVFSYSWSRSVLSFC